MPAIAPVLAAVLVRARLAALLSAALLVGCATPPPAKAPEPAPAATSKAPVDKTPESEPGPDERPLAVRDEANNVYFELRSTLIDDAGKATLREHAERLKANPKQKVTLVGHMDDLGSRNYNLAITEERLAAVSSQLRALGVQARQIRRDRASGESDSPPCRNEACRALMRRVELKYPE